MGTEPDDGTDNRQGNEGLKNIGQRPLKLPQRTQTERRAYGGKKGQAASGGRGESTENGAEGTELVKVTFHIESTCDSCNLTDRGSAAAAREPP
jgi:hypothetical protein